MTDYLPLSPGIARDPAALTPGVGGHDPLVRYWLGQVTLRLRREVCWLWRERGQQDATPGPLPPLGDPALAALDQLRYADEKRRFFEQDPAARHLGVRMVQTEMPAAAAAPRGSFGWVARELRLTPAECFVLALALLPAVDSAAGAVIACCQNDAARSAPSLALAQRLWNDQDDPEAPDAVLACLAPAHPLLRHGLLTATDSGAGTWQAPLQVPALLARALVFPGAALPPALDTVAPLAAGASAPGAVHTGAMRIVPVLGPAGAPLARVAAGHAARGGAATVRASPGLMREDLAQVLSLAWLRGAAFYLDAGQLSPADVHAAVPALPLPGLPLTVYVGMHEREQLRRLDTVVAPIVVAPLTHAERADRWRRALPVACAAMAGELARRFRYEAGQIDYIGAALKSLGRLPTRDEILAGARRDPDLGSLAQPVTPRFRRADLMLPPRQAAQLDELLAAMRNLGRAHDDWGTARAWNEGGLSALFFGAPGTGKTMAAEVIAAELGLPLFRIDLSQVVDKYVGETEKNLRRLFDSADASDVVLFFDEADALFGKRSAVKDAHDRYANLEISYLLERMERFKGLAILATNRRKDLDEAFLRRLRFAIEFPLPGPEERLRIWRGALPDGVDGAGIDFDFLAQRFPLAGGHIRGIVFHACLQGACAGAPPRLTMAAVLRALLREYDKLERPSSLDQFGPYAALVAEQRSER
ncbi:MAG: ATP-binding protein [Pseudomonadota bacterium]